MTASLDWAERLKYLGHQYLGQPASLCGNNEIFIAVLQLGRDLSSQANLFDLVRVKTPA